MYLSFTDVDWTLPRVLPSFMQIGACESKKKMLLDVILSALLNSKWFTALKAYLGKPCFYAHISGKFLERERNCKFKSKKQT